MRSRELGYRVLGRRLDYVLHLRPAEWPIVAVHAATGAVLAIGLPALALTDIRTVLLGIGLWVVCLNGGTLAINSAFDRDEGDIAYLRAPPNPPPHLFTFGAALMVFGLGVAAALPLVYWQAYACCVGLSVLYSVPPMRLKAVAGIDWFINMWGFGTITPFAGWAATGLPVTGVGETVLLAFCPLFAGLYPLTQLYQLEEDRRRGDRRGSIEEMVKDFGARRRLPRGEVANVRLQIRQFEGGSVSLFLDEWVQIADVRARRLVLRGDRGQRGTLSIARHWDTGQNAGTA